MAKKDQNQSKLSKISGELPNDKRDRQSKTDSTKKLLDYVSDALPLLQTLMKDFSKQSKDAQDKILKEQQKSNKILDTLSKNSSQLNKSNAEFLKQSQNSNKHLKQISDNSKIASDQAKQKLKADDFAEERNAEAASEQKLFSEKAQETQQHQNAEMITKLTTLDESINSLSLSGGGEGGGGLLGGIFGGLMDLLKKGIAELLPIALSALGGLMGTLAGLAGALFENPIFLAALTAALAGAAGYLIFKKFVEPWMDDKQKEVKAALKDVAEGPSIRKEDVTTDKGEQVFKKEDTKTGNVSYVSESQMKQELATMTPEERKKTEEGEGQVSYSKASNIVDVHSGMYTGDALKTGSSIEEINKAAKEIEQANLKMSPSEKAMKNFTREITNFDESFRSRLAKTMTAWANSGGLETSLAGSRENFKEVLGALYNEHTSIINRLRSNKDISEQDKIQLTELSPLFDKSLEEDPDYDTLWVLGYDLPNGEGLTFDWGSSSQTIEENRAKIDAEFNSPSNRAKELKKKYQALEEKQKNTQPVKGMEMPPQAADGAVVYPKTGKGVLTNISEDMKPEAVVPLDKYVISEKDQIQETEVGGNIANAMRSSYFEERDAKLQSYQPVIINNVNNNSMGGGGEGANMQYQTSLARTFDTVYEMLLQKNMKIAIE
jgi:hypothetical protein